MNKELSSVLEAVRLYQSINEEIARIDREKDNLSVNSEYWKKVNELLKSFGEEGLFFVSPEESIYDKPFDELLADVDEKVQSKINMLSDYDEAELIDYYNNELSEEDKKQYASYEEFKKKLLEDYFKEQDAKKTKLNNLLNEFKNLKSSYDDMNRKLQELDGKRITLLNERWELLQTKLNNYSVDFMEKGMEYQNGFPLVKDDMDVVNKEKEFDENNFSVNDLVMVHATDYFPQNGIIKSTRDATDSKRNTIHTSLNGRVSSHNFGNWDDCGIIVLDPLKEHIDQVECVYSVDTFTYGSMRLSSDAMILINNNKFAKIYEENKDYIDKNKNKIMLYSGNSLLAVEKVLSMLGYVTQKCDQWSWEDKKANDMLNNLVKTQYPNKLNVAHDVTPYSTVEKSLTRKDTLASFGIKDDGNDIIITPDILYALRNYNKNITLEQFITNVGVFVNDNEIHLLGIKDHIELLRSGKVSPFQIEKIDLLLKKYELMQHYQEEKENTSHR